VETKEKDLEIKLIDFLTFVWLRNIVIIYSITVSNGHYDEFGLVVVMTRTAVTVGIQEPLVRATIKGSESGRLAVTPLGRGLGKVTFRFHVFATSHTRSVATSLGAIFTVPTSLLASHVLHGELFACITSLKAASVAMSRHIRHRSIFTSRHVNFDLAVN